MDFISLQIFIYLWVMNHFTQQKNAFALIFFYCFESNVNGVFNTIAKPKVAGKVNMNRTKIEQGRREVFFQPVGLLFVCFL